MRRRTWRPRCAIWLRFATQPWPQTLAVAVDGALALDLAGLAGGVTGVALGLFLGLEHGLQLDLLGGEALALGGFADLGFRPLGVGAGLGLLGGEGFGGEALLGLDLFQAASLGAFGLANLASLDHGLAFGFALLHGRIISGRASAEFFHQSLTGLGGGSLTVLVILSG